MSFIPNKKQMKEIQTVLENVLFYNIKTINYIYETNAKVIKSALPPPLECKGTPLVLVSGFSMDSNCVGPFLGVSFWLSCNYRQIEGWYCFSMYVNTDTSLIFGREFYGEPKKMADIHLEVKENKIEMEVKRADLKILSLEAAITEIVSPYETKFNAFHYKYGLQPFSLGFMYEPQLILVSNTQKNDSIANCRGKLELFESSYDPVSEIEIIRMKKIVYTEGSITTKSCVLDKVNPTEFLPYIFTRIDNPLLYSQKSRFKD